MKTGTKFEKYEQAVKLAETGMALAEACRQVGIRPEYAYSIRNKLAAKNGKVKQVKAVKKPLRIVAQDPGETVSRFPSGLIFAMTVQQFRELTGAQ